jgi:hypothetical protein
MHITGRYALAAVMLLAMAPCVVLAQYKNARGTLIDGPTQVTKLRYSDMHAMYGDP